MINDVDGGGSVCCWCIIISLCTNTYALWEAVSILAAGAGVPLLSDPCTNSQSSELVIQRDSALWQHTVRLMTSASWPNTMSYVHHIFECGSTEGSDIEAVRTEAIRQSHVHIAASQVGAWKCSGPRWNGRCRPSTLTSPSDRRYDL